MLRKFGTGEVLPEEGDNTKVAKKDWTPDDDKALQEENEEADGDK